MTVIFPDTRMRAYHDRDAPYCCDFDCDKADRCDRTTCDLLDQESQDFGLCKLLRMSVAEREKREVG